LNGASSDRLSVSDVTEPASPEDVLELVLNTLEDGKAENVITIDLNGKSSIADAMVVASGRSQRQVSALASQLVEKLKASSAPMPKVEGMSNADWVLVDVGDVIVHLFRPEVREFYNLEKMWMADLAEAAQ
jgi:ribosome-associated protein